MAAVNALDPVAITMLQQGSERSEVFHISKDLVEMIGAIHELWRFSLVVVEDLEVQNQPISAFNFVDPARNIGIEPQ